MHKKYSVSRIVWSFENSDQFFLLRGASSHVHQMCLNELHESDLNDLIKQIYIR